jgi:hypothetical protein
VFSVTSAFAGTRDAIGNSWEHETGNQRVSSPMPTTITNITNKIIMDLSPDDKSRTNSRNAIGINERRTTQSTVTYKPKITQVSSFHCHEMAPSVWGRGYQE